MNVLYACVLATVLGAAGDDATEPARNPYTQLLDTGAQVLKPGQHQVGLFFGEYTLGLLPQLQLSSHLGGVLVSYLNLNAKVQLLKRDDVQVALSAGGGWLALAQLLTATLASVPVDLRATLPWGDDWEFSIGPSVRWLILDFDGTRQQSQTFYTESTLVRYDTFGAWFLRGTIPMVVSQQVSLTGLVDTPLVGQLLLDDVSAFSLMVGRDQLLGKYVHLRMGAGYRNRPGLVLFESLGPLLLEFNLYVRWGGDT